MSLTAERKPHLSGRLESGGPTGSFPKAPSRGLLPMWIITFPFPKYALQLKLDAGFFFSALKTLQHCSVAIKQLPRPIPEEAEGNRVGHL